MRLHADSTKDMKDEEFGITNAIYQLVTSSSKYKGILSMYTQAYPHIESNHINHVLFYRVQDV